MQLVGLMKRGKQLSKETVAPQKIILQLLMPIVLQVNAPCCATSSTACSFGSQSQVQQVQPSWSWVLGLFKVAREFAGVPLTLGGRTLFPLLFAYSRLCQVVVSFFRNPPPPETDAIASDTRIPVTALYRCRASD